MTVSNSSADVKVEVEVEDDHHELEDDPDVLVLVHLSSPPLRFKVMMLRTLSGKMRIQVVYLMPRMKTKLK